jgi:hypothetical protein
MAQSDAERIMGLLAQSGTFRIAFGKDPVGVLTAEGVKLTDADKDLLKTIDFKKLSAQSFSKEGCGSGYCTIG